jgi:hypothetical protein
MEQGGMRVILLGAGASKCAGYPLAGELISELKREAQTNSTHFRNFSEAWKTWEDAVNRAKGLLQLLLTSPNPEVVLSVPDLFEAAFDAEISENFADLARSKGRNFGDDLLNTARQRTRRARRFQKLIVASKRFRECIDWFFRFKHFEDSKPENRNRRDYLRELLSKLRSGDTVITLNWDTTVERTLLEECRWNPCDGYGFNKELSREGKERPTPSEIIVLKLHGSLGWHRSRDNRLYFDSKHGFLRYLVAPTVTGEVSFRDPLEANVVGLPGDSVLAYPSFLKQLAGVEMQEIWTKANQAFLTADSVEVWGYSLPASDVAVRTILAPLRSRLNSESRSFEVNVHDPNREVGRCWKEFLGPLAKIDRTPLGSCS